MMPIHRLTAIWKDGEARSLPFDGRVHVSMNDYLIRERRDILRVAREGLSLRQQWPQTPGALGLWFAAFRFGRRQVSVSVWRAPEDLKAFVRSPGHRRIMKEHRDTGSLYTSSWTASCLDKNIIWRQASDRLAGLVDGVPHH